MKNKINKKYLHRSVYAIAILVISGVLLFSFQKMPDLGSLFSSFFSVLAPVIWGVIIAYVLSQPQMFFENKVFGKVKNRSHARTFSLITLILLVIIGVAAFLGFALPQLAQSVLKIFYKVPEYLKNITVWAQNTFAGNVEVAQFLENPVNNMTMAFNDWLNKANGADSVSQIAGFAANVGAGAWSVLSALKDIIIGFIIAIYFLAAKEMIQKQIRKLLFSFSDNDFCLDILGLCKTTDKIFHRYLSGLVVDAFLVGLLTFIGACVIGTPVPLLLAVIIAITNFIPFFGPFIGGIPAAFIVLMDNPLKALIFVIFMLILQQFDGNVIVPFIQGDVTGVPSVWVLIAIIMGGGLFGIPGMFLSVPVFAVIYMLGKRFVENKLRKKQMPVCSSSYETTEDLVQYRTGFVYTETVITEDDIETKLNEETKLHKLFMKIKGIFRK